MKRRTFLKQSTLSSAALLTGATVNTPPPLIVAPNDVARPLQEVEVLNPRMRVPVSFIIDDSTALVNMAYYGIPQFKEVFPDKYLQDWRTLPREIPDDFVEEFLDWCDSHGVKGKYSMVPYPACTGWLNRFIPGWTKSELETSIRLVRERAQPNWDIHPEMISHTRVIDIKTGLPFPDATPEFMENWEWSQTKSADELGEYIAYALRILKDADLYCEGVTTPGGFAHRNIPNLARATQAAVREVYGGRVAHFFRDVITEPGKSVQPQVFNPIDLRTDYASCSVHIIACTGDWFGGWDGLTPGDADRFITADLSAGRMVEVIGQGEPAIFICHWPGMYYNGEKLGFDIFKTVVTRLEEKYDHLIWMKLSDIARYWAAKEYTEVRLDEQQINFRAPFATDLFTFRTKQPVAQPLLQQGDRRTALKRVRSENELERNSWCRVEEDSVVCLDLPQGRSWLIL